MIAPYESQWLEYHEHVRRASAHTLKAYKVAIKQYRRFLKSRHKSPLTAEFADVVAFAASMDAAPATIRVKLAAVRSLHAFMVATSVRPSDPAAIVSGPRKRDSDRTREYAKHPLELIELVRAQLELPAQRAAFALMYDCGLRVASAATFERAGLCVVEWQASCLIKGGKDHSVPVWSAAARRDLIKQWELTTRERYLLPGRAGPGHLHTATLNRWIHEAAIAAGLDETLWSPHALRHSRAEHLRDNLDPFELQRFMGHDQIDTTAIYTDARLESSPVLATLPARLSQELPTIFQTTETDAIA